MLKKNPTAERIGIISKRPIHMFKISIISTETGIPATAIPAEIPALLWAETTSKRLLPKSFPASVSTRTPTKISKA